MSVIEKTRVSEQEKKILLAKAVKEGLILAVNKARSNKKLSSLFRFDDLADTFISKTLEDRFRGIDRIRLLWASTDYIIADTKVQVEIGNILYDIRVTINFSANEITYAEIKTYKLLDSTTERI